MPDYIWVLLFFFYILNKTLAAIIALNFSTHQSSVIFAPLDINLKVVAVPGSGKSTVLIYRIEQFLIADYAAKDMVVVMFNDDAVVNFTNDLKQIDFMDVPDVKTYHSLGRSICNMLEVANFMNKATLIVSKKDYRFFYQSILIHFTPLNQVEIIKPDRASTISQFIRFVELTKAGLSSPDTAFYRYGFDDKFKIFIDLFHHSERERVAGNKRFFTDLIRDPLLACIKNVKARSFVTNRYKVVMVDEYQDASPICHELVKLIAGSKANINVVGDGDQAIYSFTGASSEFLLSEIDKDFPDVKFFSLPETFRYGHTVCLLANNCISNNADRDNIICISGIPTPTKLTIANYTAEIVDIEHYDIIEEIDRWLDKPNACYEDIAFLVRSYGPISGFEFALIKHSIPYKLGSGNNYILECEEVRWVESILIIFCPSSSDEDVTNALYIYLTSFTYRVTPTVLALVMNLLLKESYDEAILAIKPLFKTLPRTEYIGFRSRIKALSLVDEHGYTSSNELITKICENSAIISAVNRMDYSAGNFGVRKFVASRQFLSSLNSNISLALSSLRQHRETMATPAKDCIEITTLHKSKGLAWPFVIVGFLEENILPNIALEKDVSVERKLYFVGITRAKKQLTLHIPNDDTKLIECSASNLGTMAEVDYGVPFMASRFVYESNIIASVKVASAIYNNTPPEIGKTYNLETFNRYLAAIKVDFRLSGI